MMERSSPPLGSYEVHAFTFAGDAGTWRACGQAWLTQANGDRILLSEAFAGPGPAEQATLDEAYERAYAEVLRLILREFACL